VLTRRRAAPAHWAASDDRRHWNHWRREALVYASGLPARPGLGAPRVLDVVDLPDGDVELRLEHVDGRHAGALTIDDLVAAAVALGRAQGRADLPDAGARCAARAAGLALCARWASELARTAGLAAPDVAVQRGRGGRLG
jgi:hypothetical protein